MTTPDRKAGAAVLRAVLAALLLSGADRAGQGGADVRRLCGLLSAQAEDRIEAGDFGAPLQACFQAATAAGASFDGMERARIAASSPSSRPVVTNVAQTSVRFALIEMSLILAATTFESRSDAETALARINAAYQPAEDFAADERAADVYRALVALHAATVRDLTQRSRQLPRLVSFAFPRRTPAVALANRLYGDGGRHDELIAENRVVHPLFFPASGRALAV